MRKLYLNIPLSYLAIIILLFPYSFLSKDIQSIASSYIQTNDNEKQVLQYLAAIQDNFSDDRLLVPAMEDNSGQTFNNALTAMAFILKGQKGRAERILDFYAARTDSSNSEPNRQNFFYNNEARGFYQNVILSKTYDATISDRWMGDNTWLLLAFKFYEKEYGLSGKPIYSKLIAYLKNLLIDFYIDDPTGHGGFIRHGWRWGPRNSSNPTNDYQLHEFDSSGKPIGHEEGNIDAYAALKLCGETEKAEKIKQWLDYRMNELEKIPGINLPLDLYSWRSLAFTSEGDYYKNLVDVPENDSRFKKEIIFNEKKVTGFFSFASGSINNVWLDGLGHMVCAFYSSGRTDKAEFYSAQLDSFLIKRYIGAVTQALPYTANKSGGYDWVDVTKGFSSACAWYIFAKNGFNPFTFDKNIVSSSNEKGSSDLNFKLLQNFPNPFNNSTMIRYSIPENLRVEIEIFDLLGKKIKTLYSGIALKGFNQVEWNGKNVENNVVASGIYLYRIKSEAIIMNGKMILQK